MKVEVASTAELSWVCCLACASAGLLWLLPSDCCAATPRAEPNIKTNTHGHDEKSDRTRALRCRPMRSPCVAANLTWLNGASQLMQKACAAYNFEVQKPWVPTQSPAQPGAPHVWRAHSCARKNYVVPARELFIEPPHADASPKTCSLREGGIPPPSHSRAFPEHRKPDTDHRHDTRFLGHRSFKKANKRRVHVQTCLFSIVDNPCAILARSGPHSG